MTPACRLLTLLALPVLAFAQSGFPYHDETLSYSVNWPGGASLGEGRLTAKHDAVTGRWEFELTLDASIPAITITDRFRSIAANFCSSEFEKDSVHGPRKALETTTFDQAAGAATRKTRNGGTSSLDLPPCAKDALAFLFFARREMSQGRVPPPDTVFFGGPYQVRLEYKGAANLAVQGRTVTADRVVGTVAGKSSSHLFEVFFDRDAARTPLVFRLPLALGTFSMELVR